MKFGQFMSNYKRKNFIQICPNQYADLHRILFTEDSLKIKKGLELVFRPNFSYNFFNKKNYFVILHKLAKFHYQTVFTSQVIQKYVFRVSC